MPVMGCSIDLKNFAQFLIQQFNDFETLKVYVLRGMTSPTHEVQGFNVGLLQDPSIMKHFKTKFITTTAGKEAPPPEPALRGDQGASAANGQVEKVE